jgi:hypothetical protein
LWKKMTFGCKLQAIVTRLQFTLLDCKGGDMPWYGWLLLALAILVLGWLSVATAPAAQLFLIKLEKRWAVWKRAKKQAQHRQSLNQ